MIAICPNPFRDNDLALTKELVAMLGEEGFQTQICPVFADDQPGILPDGLPYSSLSDIGGDCTLAVVVG